MSTTFTETDYENSIIELFQNMGYQYVYGPDIERDFYSPLYNDVLVEYIHRLNPSLPEEAISGTEYSFRTVGGCFRYRISRTDTRCPV